MTIVIGSGYLGLRFQKHFAPTAGTHLPELVHGNQIPVDFAKTNFNSLPLGETLIITCSVETLGSKAKAFADYVRTHYKHVMLISSASLFSVTEPNQDITEASPLKKTARVDAESR